MFTEHQHLQHLFVLLSSQFHLSEAKVCVLKKKSHIFCVIRLFFHCTASHFHLSQTLPNLYCTELLDFPLKLLNENTGKKEALYFLLRGF